MLNATQISVLAITASLSFASLPSSALAAQRDALFQSARGQATKVQRGRTALPGKSRAVKVDKTQLGKGRMRLNLGLGPDLIAVRERSAEHRGGRKAWIGRIAGDDDSQVVFAEVGNAVAGTIRHRGRLYKLMPGAGGNATLAEVDGSDPLPSGHMPDPLAGLRILPDTIGEGETGSIGGESTGSESIVDVLVAFSPEAKAANGGEDGIEAVITLAVAETNQAYLNSQAPVQLRLVGTVETVESESGSMSTDLGRLASTTDGHLDDVLVEREALGADVVSLIVHTGDYCGVGYQMGMLHPAYAEYAFNVVKDDCATGYYSLGHEVGHNLGLSHDHANATSGVFPYSFGYQEPTGAFRTVMAYTCTGGCTRIQHFSNPEISYDGQLTGVYDYADNALALADTAPLVSTWRESQAPLLPISPSDLVASVQGYDRIDLSWSDAALEEGYQLERSIDGGQSFVLIASLAADSVSYSDTGLAAETGYIYRLSAFNSAGVADPSNEAWATTESAPVPAPNAPSALVAQAASDSEIALNWTDNADDETGFELERDSATGWQLIATLAADTGTYTDQGLEAETAYAYRIRATGNGGPSEYSAAVSVVTDPAPVYPPAAPADLSASAVSESAIQLSWSDQALDEDGFEIERSSDGGQSWTAVASLSADQTGYDDDGLAAETFYLYRVRAYGQGGESAWSDTAGAATQAPASSCQVEGAASLRLYSNTAYWKLTNTGTEDLSITRIELSWLSAQGYLKTLYLAGATIWKGRDAPSTADIDSGWDSNASRRVLNAGDSEDLKLKFSRRYYSDGQDDYSITLHFNDGCSLSF